MFSYHKDNIQRYNKMCWWCYSTSPKNTHDTYAIILQFKSCQFDFIILTPIICGGYLKWVVSQLTLISNWTFEKNNYFNQRDYVTRFCYIATRCLINAPLARFNLWPHLAPIPPKVDGTNPFDLFVALVSHRPMYVL